jgi:hypothetical protein
MKVCICRHDITNVALVDAGWFEVVFLRLEAVFRLKHWDVDSMSTPSV